MAVLPNPAANSMATLWDVFFARHACQYSSWWLQTMVSRPVASGAGQSSWMRSRVSCASGPVWKSVTTMEACARHGHKKTMLMGKAASNCQSLRKQLTQKVTRTSSIVAMAGVASSGAMSIAVIALRTLSSNLSPKMVAAARLASSPMA